MAIFNFRMISTGEILLNPLIYILPIFIGLIAGFIYGSINDGLANKIKIKTKKVQESKKLFEDLLTFSPNLIMIHDKNHKLKYSNFKHIGSLDKEIRNNPFCKNKHSKENPCNVMVVFHDKTQRKFETSDLIKGKVFDYVIYPIKDDLGNVDHAVTIATDVTDKKRYQKELEKMSNIDPLTQIYNRRKFDEEYNKEWNSALRTNENLTIIMGDIDFFKQYNDFYGHVKGDDVLVNISSSILNNIKRSKDVLARYGGEEFIIMLPNTDLEGGLHLANKLRKKIEDLNIEHEKSSFGKITMCFGVTSVKVDSNVSKKKIIKIADIALYLAKKNGRNRIESENLK